MIIEVDKAQKEEKRRLQRRIEEMVRTDLDEIAFILDNYRPSSYYDVIYSAIRNANLPWERNDRVKHFVWGKISGVCYLRRIS